MILLPIYLGRELGSVSKLAAIALTLVLAELTYRFSTVNRTRLSLLIQLPIPSDLPSASTKGKHSLKTA